MKAIQFHENRIKEDREHLRNRRDLLVDDIKMVFRDVNRKGGVSLAETEPLDAGASKQTCLRIRAQQRDKHWWEVDLRKHDPSGSGLCFLDPIGFRYHAPAYMIDALTVGNSRLDNCEHDGWNGHHTIIFLLTNLTSSLNEFYHLFDDQQRTCVARFLAIQLELYYIEGNDDVANALRDYWVRYLPEHDKTRISSIWPDLLT